MALKNDDRSSMEPAQRVGIFTIGFRVLSGFAIILSPDSRGAFSRGCQIRYKSLKGHQNTTMTNRNTEL